MRRLTGFLTMAMRAREQSHRRSVLWGIGGLLLLSLSPVVGHHVSTSLDEAFMGQDHAWILCLIALHALLAPVHGLFHVLLIVGLLYAVCDRLHAIGSVRATLRLLVIQPGHTFPSIQAAMHAAGVPPDRLSVVRGLANPAFTAGWWTPTIYVAEEIIEVLNQAQLVTVLAHEAEHVRRRDPLRVSVLRFLGCTLFWIPAFRNLAADMADEAEIAADDAAAGVRPLVLASAILALAAWRGPQLVGSASRLPPGAVVGLVPDHSKRRAPHDPLLDRRVRRLAGETARVSTHLTKRSLFSATAMLGAVWVSGIAVAHPMPSGTTAAAVHCTHAHERPFAHLFCRLDHPRNVAPDGARCPHVHGVARAS